jgi:hypothetical protein
VIGSGSGSYPVAGFGIIGICGVFNDFIVAYTSVRLAKVNVRMGPLVWGDFHFGSDCKILNGKIAG